jgi:crotonobetainyl-CoA:carnitine CoA-transferase CaiB-like acyl-CoA transferase
MGREDLFDTPLCQNQNIRIQHREEIDELISGWTKTRTIDEIMDILTKADVPVSRLPTFREICNDPQLLSRNMIIEVDQPLSGKVKTTGSLFKLSKTPGDIHYPAPFLGEHNEEVYSEFLGYSPERITQLSNDGII